MNSVVMLRSFSFLTTSLSILYNYFDDLTNLFSALRPIQTLWQNHSFRVYFEIIKKIVLINAKKYKDQKLQKYHTKCLFTIFSDRYPISKIFLAKHLAKH